MTENEVAIFQRSIVECGDPVEIARKVKLAFKKMPGEMALACNNIGLWWNGVRRHLIRPEV